MLADQVVHETIDGETVVIDLAAGTYFSLEGAAAEMWEHLLTGASPEATADALAGAHGAEREAMLAAVLGLHADLHAAGLLTAAPAPAPAGVTPFAVPPLRAYEDLREHLLLDPIHDVERGAGWPAIPS